MKTTANKLVGWIAVAVVLWAGVAVAGPIGSGASTYLGLAALGQSAPANNASGDRGQQAADLLVRARQALVEDNLTAAEALISKAEALDVQYHALYMGDTPKKVRRDLERKRQAASPSKPSRLFAPLGLNKNEKTPTNDPFAGRGITPLPKVEDAGAARGPMMQVSGAVPPTHEPNLPTLQTRSTEHPLQTARLALAVGDLRRAAEFLQKAKAAPNAVPTSTDSPERVEAAIRKVYELSSFDKSTEAYRRAYARSLTEQADALARWGELDVAEGLAGRAAGMPILYGPTDQKPQDVLQRIVAARRQGAGDPSQAPSADAGFATASSPPSPSIAARQKAVELVRHAREAIAANDLDRAEAFARQAEQLRLSDSAFAPGEDRPGLVMLDLRQLRLRESSSGVVPAAAQQVIPAGGDGQPDRYASRAVYDSSSDPTRNVQASGAQPSYPRLAQNLEAVPTPPGALSPPAPPPESNVPGPAKTQGVRLFEQGEAALKARDMTRAHELFSQAAARMNELDPMTAQRLQDHLQLMSGPARPRPQTAAPTMSDDAAGRRQVLARKVFAELAHKEANAVALRESDPKAALAMLEEARKGVETSGLDTPIRDQLLRRVDRAIADTKQFIEKNKPQIELADRNVRAHQDVDRERRLKVEVGEKLALMVDDFNNLMDEQRYEEAQVIAKRAAELDPDNPVVVQINLQAKFIRNYQNAMSIKEQKEDGFMATLGNVDVASIPFDDKKSIVYPDAKDWSKLSASRRKLALAGRRPQTEREMEIEKKLRTPVSLQFTNAPLSKVLDNLAKLGEVNLYLDPQGLAEEGVTSDTPVTIELRSEIMLKSALNLILEPLHLSYLVKDEVLKITSEQMRDGHTYKKTYNVADLVIPIPNFVPTEMGIQAAYTNSLSKMGFGGGTAPLFGTSQSTPLSVVATRNGKGNTAPLNPAMYAQQMGSAAGGPGALPRNTPVGSGPGGLGGGAQADFDSLIELIKSTVKPTTWDDVGGPGSIAPFETNLSIVVSQTQDVHEEIDDLLQQLRRLQDLQVTIEVRFITLNDNFFERIGVSFDFNINDNIDGKGYAFGARASPGPFYSNPSGFTTNQGVPRDVTNQDTGRTATVGMSAPGVFSADLDIPFTQNSYSLAVPQFGGFDATAGAQLGFAILSDVEAYFFINAAQGDKRTNVLQAPKVTLFNGQQAYVSDTSQSPFVISVIPVVGDFAAAQQPVIVVLSEGTFMTVQAVVSSDRRFVRLTVVPFFSRIGDVNTFTFSGATTTTTDTTREGLQSAATDASKLWNKTGDNTSTTSSGTTVQLPTFSFVTVTTTVSVPDGGTVLLGGIKRLSEGRNEFGVPMLNKLPYINRLFKNVGIGRETQSLMMMVTPRIIIQEEEEQKLGIEPQS